MKMITYTPLWETMRKKEMSAYRLIRYYGFSSNTIYRLRHNQGISTTLLDRLCLLLNCNVEDIIEYIPSGQAEP